MPTRLSVVGARCPSLTIDRRRVEHKYYKIEIDVTAAHLALDMTFRLSGLMMNFKGD